MLESIFHAWERRLAAATKDRVVRPFEWGVEWIPANGHGGDAAARVRAWIDEVMADTDAFFATAPTDDYALDAERDAAVLTFPSALATPHPENNTVRCRYFPARAPATGRRRAAVVVLPQWNSDANGHVGLCRLLAWAGLSALRLTLPYHERRMPPELHRADYIVS